MQTGLKDKKPEKVDDLVEVEIHYFTTIKTKENSVLAYFDGLEQLGDLAYAGDRAKLIKKGTITVRQKEDTDIIIGDDGKDKEVRKISVYITRH